MYEDNEHIKQGMSRREFLKIGAGALVFLAELGLPKNVLAELEELLKKREFLSENFEDGIDLLKKDVWENTDERMLLYVEKNNKKGWIDIGENASDEDVYSIDLDHIFDDKEITKLLLAHTHPATTYKKLSFLEPRIAQDMVEKRQTPFPIPPSSNDIFTAIRIQYLLRERGNKLSRVSCLVAEPTGTWEYIVDINHPALQRLYAYFEEHDPRYLHMLGEKLNEWRQKFFQEKERMEENIRVFQEWAKRDYGITMIYKPEK